MFSAWAEMTKAELSKEMCQKLKLKMVIFYESNVFSGVCVRVSVVFHLVANAILNGFESLSTIFISVLNEMPTAEEHCVMFVRCDHNNSFLPFVWYTSGSRHLICLLVMIVVLIACNVNNL